ncbi:hypothetical protein EDC01DRAFT_410425 [Geopyxis carbonaria]|nr:hypothetical protein EDC01DRAFT_410425 [Geopyxis carbonaria]
MKQFCPLADPDGIVTIALFFPSTLPCHNKQSLQFPPMIHLMTKPAKKRHPTVRTFINSQPHLSPRTDPFSFVPVQNNGCFLCLRYRHSKHRRLRGLSGRVEAWSCPSVVSCRLCESWKFLLTYPWLQAEVVLPRGRCAPGPQWRLLRLVRADVACGWIVAACKGSISRAAERSESERSSGTAARSFSSSRLAELSLRIAFSCMAESVFCTGFLRLVPLTAECRHNSAELSRDMMVGRLNGNSDGTCTLRELHTTNLVEVKLSYRTKTSPVIMRILCE